MSQHPDFMTAIVILLSLIIGYHIRDRGMVFKIQESQPSTKLNISESTQINEVEAIPLSVDLLKEPLNEIVRYIISKGGEVEISALKNWGKSRRKETINSGEIKGYLLEMMEMCLVETFKPANRKCEFVKWTAKK